MNNESLDEKYWSQRYKSESTGWDLGEVSPPLQAYIDQLSNKNISILIPGCGNAYEASYLLQKGFTNITLVDISPILTDQLKRKFVNEIGKSIHVICDDFFNLQGQFDLILEQTFFCSFKPENREKYRDKIFSLLKADGKLVGVLFNREFTSSPPFGGNEAEYHKLFSSNFTIKTMSVCYNSAEPRLGSELFVILAP
jgi:SAM-dependent methyltransferase